MRFILKYRYKLLSLVIGIAVSLFLVKLQVNSLAAVAIGVAVTVFFIDVFRKDSKPKEPKS